MSFVEEYPVSQELLNRFDWTALPLLYQGEAGMYCNIPHFVLIDHEQDLVYYTGGGGIGRTTREIQPDTEVLYYKGIPIRFFIKTTSSENYNNEIRNLYPFYQIEYSVIKIVAPFSLLKTEEEFIEAIIASVKARKYSRLEMDPEI